MIRIKQPLQRLQLSFPSDKHSAVPPVSFIIVSNYGLVNYDLLKYDSINCIFLKLPTQIDS